MYTLSSRNTVRRRSLSLPFARALGPHTFAGPVVRVGPNEVCFSDVSAFRQIYNIKETFVKSPLYETITASPAPSIFSTADVDLHRRHRRLLAPGLSESSVAQMASSVHSKVALAVQRMKEEMEERGTADIYKWWTFMTLEITGELTFGRSFSILEKGKVSVHDATSALSLVMAYNQSLTFLRSPERCLHQ
jgi:cytochrome P450